MNEQKHRRPLPLYKSQEELDVVLKHLHKVPLQSYADKRRQRRRDSIIQRRT